MGKTKKGFNWRARQQKDVVVDRSTEKQIPLEAGLEKGHYDDSNVLVLPSEKRKTASKNVHDESQQTKKLSKKQRKRLEKVVEQREKKSKRTALLNSLAKVQASSEEINLFTSTSEMQTKKCKRKLEITTTSGGKVKVNAISGSNKMAKKKRKIEMMAETTHSDSESSIHTSDMSSDDEEGPGTGNIGMGNTGTGVSRTEFQGKSLSSDAEKGQDKVPSQTGIAIVDSVKNRTKSDVPQAVLQCDNKPCSKDVMVKQTVHIPVQRKPEIQGCRLKLPILGEEQEIMEAVSLNPVLIICGETGSGKTTQLPQFLYEAGYAHGGSIIGVTEPRRVAAISMSYRVAMEMNLATREVSYQIRYEGTVTEDTKVKFMTDGVLLKEVQKDFLLTRYSVIIIDEAHERTVYTDILIGLLSRIVPLRHKKGNPLKLIIMSATLRVEDFTENQRLFKVIPPVITVESRQFPVTIHFNKRTPVEDYLGETYRKVCKIHRMLPEGAILVFVTGQQEVHTLCKKLQQTFPSQQQKADKSKGETVEKTKRKEGKMKKTSKDDVKPMLPNISLDNYSVSPHDEEAEMDLAVENSDGEVTDAADSDGDHITQIDLKGEMTSCPLYVLPLYSLLSTDRQQQVFKPVPAGWRLCVVTTNVAETSLTIPDIKYVVDTGKVKIKVYDKVTGVCTLRVAWTSQASADQRAGRAGRVGPGHCYRLYSSAVFKDNFEKFSPPEITRRPVEDLVLQMKDMNIDKVINFPYPTSPDPEQIKAAERLLVSLGALEQPDKPQRFKDTKKALSTKITALGRAITCFPVSPRYGKMLALGHQHDLLAYVVAMVSALSVQEIFIEIETPPATENEREEQRQRRRRLSQIRHTWAGTGHSLLLGDQMVMLKAVGSCEYEGSCPAFCDKHGLRYKAMKEIRKLRVQLTNAVNGVMSDTSLCVDPKMAPPNDLQAKLLRQIVLAGLSDHVARRYPDPPAGADESRKALKHAYQCTELDEPVYIHATSVLYRQKAEFVVYQHIQETSKVYMKGVTAVKAEWLPIFAASHCTLSKPLDDPPPSYCQVKDQVVCHMTSTYGRCSWGVPAVELVFPPGLDRFKWFARFLLEGEVITNLGEFRPHLLSAPSVMVKSWAKLQPRTETLLKTLISQSVDSKLSLLEAWRINPKYLLHAYIEWIPQVQHERLRQLWPLVAQ